MAVETRADARRALLAGLIDHAPTFPPAELPLDEALVEDRRVRTGAHAWLLGRLVWPADRVAALGGYDQVPVSLVLGGHGQVPGTGTWPVEAVEARWPALPRFAGEVFVELPLDAELEQNLARVRAAGALAKVRCGGERTPSADELARFLRACVAAGVAFKASAGLHHAVREGESHGFLNLLAAALWPDVAEEALADADLARCQEPGRVLSEHGFRWGGREAGADEIRAMRRERFRSFGSCSFAEPVDDLRALGLL